MKLRGYEQIFTGGVKKQGVKFLKRTKVSKVKDYLTAEEVFLKLGYKTKDALLKACQRREIPHIRVSPRRVLFDPDDINAFLEKRKVEASRRFPSGERR
jgi:hypothetical protein